MQRQLHPFREAPDRWIAETERRSAMNTAGSKMVLTVQVLALAFTVICEPLMIEAQSRNPPELAVKSPALGSIPHAAVAWAKSQSGEGFAGYVANNELLPWTDHCAHFVANAYGLTSSDFGAKSASELWNLIPHKVEGKFPAEETPEGALVFWTYTDDKGKDLGGHVGIYVGNKKVISTDGKVTHPVCEQDIGEVALWLSKKAKSKYLGYASAPDSWPGPLLPSPEIGASPNSLRIAELTGFPRTLLQTRFTNGPVATQTLPVLNASKKVVVVTPLLSAKAAEKHDETRVPPYFIDKAQLSASIPPFTVLTERLELAPGEIGEVVIRLDKSASTDAEAEVHFLVGGMGIASARVSWRGY
jgi:hypothetical protein